MATENPKGELITLARKDPRISFPQIRVHEINLPGQPQLWQAVGTISFEEEKIERESTNTKKKVASFDVATLLLNEVNALRTGLRGVALMQMGEREREREMDKIYFVFLNYPEASSLSLSHIPSLSPDSPGEGHTETSTYIILCCDQKDLEEECQERGLKILSLSPSLSSPRSVICSCASMEVFQTIQRLGTRRICLMGMRRGEREIGLVNERERKAEREREEERERERDVIRVLLESKKLEVDML